MHFLDDLCNYPDPTSVKTRAGVKKKGQEWIMHGDFSGSLDDAFRIWDAVSESQWAWIMNKAYSVSRFTKESRQQGML